MPNTECQHDYEICQYCGIHPTSANRHEETQCENDHDCYYEACKDTHMKEYVRPKRTRPVNQQPPYRNPENPWEQRKSDTSQAPKKRINAKDLINLAKKHK